MTPPTVSVVLIFFDDEQFLAEAIESVRRQMFEDWELILADDGSQDRSPEIAHRYAAEQPERIRWVEHPGHANLGISATRNLGIAHARGEHVAFLDSDDVWEPGKLAEQVAILEAYPEVGLVLGASRYWFSWMANPRAPDRIRQVGAPRDMALDPGVLSTTLYPLGRGEPPCPSTFLVRRSVLERVGGFETHMPGLYDDQGFLAKAYLWMSVYVSSRCWCRYRRHEGAVTMSTSDADYHAVRRYFLQWYGAYLEAHQLATPEVQAALRRAWWPYRHPHLAAAGRRLGLIRARLQRQMRLSTPHRPEVRSGR